MGTIIFNKNETNSALPYVAAGNYTKGSFKIIVCIDNT